MRKTPFQLHKDKWAGGCGSESCKKARKIVHYRGRIPCQVLFVGEGPGLTEDACGFPFVGNAGKLLDDIVRDGLTRYFPDLRVAFCNVVACMPREEGSDAKSGEPSPDQIESCKERLEEFIEIANPRLIVAVGRVANDHLESGYTWSTRLPEGVVVTDILHPSYILSRVNISHRPIKIQEQIIKVRDAVLRVFGEPTDL